MDFIFDDEKLLVYCGSVFLFLQFQIGRHIVKCGFYAKCGFFCGRITQTVGVQEQAVLKLSSRFQSLNISILDIVIGTLPS